MEDADWQEMWLLRDRVAKALEPHRAAKQKAIDSALTLRLPAAHPIHKRYRDDWVDFFLVSTVYLEVGDESIMVTPATGLKCKRCGKWDEYGYESVMPFPNLCVRCEVVLRGLALDGMHNMRISELAAKKPFDAWCDVWQYIGVCSLDGLSVNEAYAAVKQECQRISDENKPRREIAVRLAIRKALDLMYSTELKITDEWCKLAGTYDLFLNGILFSDWCAEQRRWDRR